MCEVRNSWKACRNVFTEKGFTHEECMKRLPKVFHTQILNISPLTDWWTKSKVSSKAHDARNTIRMPADESEKCDSIKKPAAQNRRYVSLNRVLTLIQCIQNNNCQKFTLHSPSQWWNCNALEQRMESSRAFGVKSLSLDNFLCALFSHYWTALWKMSELHMNILSDVNPDSWQIAFLLWTVCYKKTWFNDSFTSSSGPWHSSMV